MKKRYAVKGYSYNLEKNINRTYWQDEIFRFEGRYAELNGACMCVANRFRDIPRFRQGEFSIEEVKEG